MAVGQENLASAYLAQFPGLERFLSIVPNIWSYLVKMALAASGRLPQVPRRSQASAMERPDAAAFFK